jgi:ferredoxin-NADP reductase
MRLKLVKKQPVAKNAVIFWFEPNIPVHYVAGQYIELSIPHPRPDSRKTKRWFTLSSSPTEDLLAITTKLDPLRKSSFKNALNNLEMGSIVPALPPMGDFVLPKDAALPIIFVAGGIGITPYRSILKYLSDSGQKRNIRLIYIVKDQSEVAFEDIITAANIKFTKHFGRLKAEDILNYTGDIKNQAIYISGPERMVEALQKGLISSGISEIQIRTDFFHNYD